MNKRKSKIDVNPLVGIPDVLKIYINKRLQRASSSTPTYLFNFKRKSLNVSIGVVMVMLLRISCRISRRRISRRMVMAVTMSYDWLGSRHRCVMRHMTLRNMVMRLLSHKLLFSMSFFSHVHIQLSLCLPRLSTLVCYLFLLFSPCPCLLRLN